MNGKDRREVEILARNYREAREKFLEASYAVQEKIELLLDTEELKVLNMEDRLHSTPTANQVRASAGLLNQVLTELQKNEDVADPDFNQLFEKDLTPGRSASEVLSTSEFGGMFEDD